MSARNAPRILLPALALALLVALIIVDETDARTRCGLDPGQYRVLDHAHREAHRLKAPHRAQIALIEAGIVESGLRNLSWGHADSIGFLQVRVGIHGRRTAASVLRSTRAFLTRGFTGRGGAIHLARTTRLSSGAIAQAVQGSAFPHRYQAVSRRAMRLHRCLTRRTR